MFSDDTPKPQTGALDLLKRPEIITLIVAALVQLAAAAGLPARAGLDVPQGSLTLVVGAFWAVAVGAIFEGKFKGINYAGGLAQVLGSFKFRAALVAAGVVGLQAALKLFELEIPEDQLTLLLNFIIAAILGKAAVDGNSTASGQ